MSPNVSILAEKFNTLSPAQIAEVADFIEFLRLKSYDRTLTQAAAAASAPAFDAVWNNPENDVYDAL